MSHPVTYEQAVARLEENNLAYGVLPLQNQTRLIISQRGGRIFGPFLPGDGESVLYINQAFASPEAFKGFLKAKHWDLGGERLFLAPEIQYCVPDRNDFWGSYRTPKQVDPGRYTLDQPGGDQWRLAQDITLEAHNLASGTKALHLERLVRPADDPLRDVSNYGELTEGVLYAGYDHVITLSESRRNDIVSEVWDLAQLNAGGLLLIPATTPAEVTQYYEPIGEGFLTRHRHHIRLKITGDRTYKIGIKAVHLFGRAGYFHHLADGRAYLLVRSFFNNPSAGYAEEPYHSPRARGYSVHVYNDDGGLGRFGELECNGQTIGGSTGRSSSTDQMLLWIYVGDMTAIKEIALHLLGVEI